MRRNPLYVFRNLDSTGIFEVPLKSTVHIIDSNGHSKPMFVEIIGKDGLDSHSTIAEFLANPTLYIDITASGQTFSELEKIVENGNIGWRILGRNPDNYGYIGDGAIDLSESRMQSYENGATGDISFAVGYQTKAEGNYSVVFGRENKASGNQSLASGLHSNALGINSQALGNGAIARTDASIALGQFNVGTSAETILEVGIGTDEINRINALEIYRDGRITAPNLEQMEINSSKSLTTKEYVDSQITESQLEKITKNGNTGWRILGRNPLNYGNIGNLGVDFSYSNIPSTSNGSTGHYSTSMGKNVTASGEISTAEGDSTIASGTVSHAEGRSTQATGIQSHAEGLYTKAEGDNSHAEGRNNLAHGPASHAEGASNFANGMYSHAEGLSNVADGYHSHVEGSQNSAIGINSHAEGYKTHAEGKESHAEGHMSAATGEVSHAQGHGTVAQNNYMFAGGIYNVGTSDDTIFEMGIGTSMTDRRNAFEIYDDGRLVAPELTNAMIDIQGDNSLITRQYLQDNNGISELERITEGGNTGWRLYGRDPNNYSGIGDQAVDFSYSDTNVMLINGAAGSFSFAEGVETAASGLASHAAGARTEATGDYQFVLGVWNDNQPNTIFEVGIGTEASDTQNGLEVYKDGAVVAPNNTINMITAHGDYALATKEYVDVNSGSISQLEKVNDNLVVGWRLYGQDPDNYGNIGKKAVDLSLSEHPSITKGAMGDYSFASGYQTTAGGHFAHSEGAETFAGGNYSHAEGYQTRAEESYSHASGYKTRASGIGSTAIGRQTIAIGDYSVVEGQESQSVGVASHAEGYITEAQGNGSHAEGKGTIARRDFSHAAGMFNVGTETDAIHETGIGDDDAHRRNAFVIYDDGTLTAPSCTPVSLTHRGIKSLATLEYVSAIVDALVIDDLVDVDTSTTPPNDKDLLKWDAGTSLWLPGSLNTDEITEGNTNLYYTDARADARIADASIGDLSDVDITTNPPVNKDLLKFNGLGWVPSILYTDEVVETTNLYFTNQRADDRADIRIAAANLGDLNNVDTVNVTPIDGDVLTWDDTNSIWYPLKNTSPETTDDLPEGTTNLYYTDDRVRDVISSTPLRNLSDVEVLPTGEYDGAILKYNSSLFKWKLYDLAVTELADVDVATNPPTDGQVLKWNDANSIWEPNDEISYTAGTGLSLTGTEFTLSANINNLADVDTNTNPPIDGQLLKWNATTSMWEPADDIGQLTQLDFTANAGDTDFVITGKVVSVVDVYVNGSKKRMDSGGNTYDYSISDDGTDTTITLNAATLANDWVQLVYIS